MNNSKWNQIAELQEIKQLMIEEQLELNEVFNEEQLELLGEDLKLVDAALIRLTNEQNSNIVSFTEYKNNKKRK